MIARMLLVVAAALALMPAVADATKQGKYLQNCPIANVGQVDPMVSPGQVADHFHGEGGAKAWSATSTTADMLAGPTTCFLPGNHSAYWVPCFVADDGSPICPTSTGGYYGAFFGPNAEQIQPMPVGLRFIVGNSHSTTLQSSSVVFWRCDTATPPQPTLSAPPTSCPPGVGVALAFNGPRYWDGMNLDSPNHQAHVSYVKDAGHQIRIPQLQWEFHFPAAAVGKFLSSDHGVGPKGRTAHFDDWEALDPIIQAELTKCLNDPAHNVADGSVPCGRFTSSTSPWITPLVDWSNHVNYVKPDGNPAPGPA